MSKRVLQNKLEEHFGFTRFRPGQAQAVEAAMRGRDTVVIMPTGSGKSLCYQLPALELKGVTVVVSPLIALAADQSAHLAELEIDSVVLNSSCTSAEIRQARQKIVDDSTEFVFTTPERLQGTDLCDLLRRRGVDMLVIDEAHCVSQWGHDFRPDYLSLHWVRGQLGDPPVLAMTATATPETLADIERSLRLKDPEIVSTGIDRVNIHLSVERCDSETAKQARLAELLRFSDGQTICYVATVKATEELVEILAGLGVDTVSYHGRMRTADRVAAQEAFMSNKARVMIATNAFGLGIDKPDIRQVIHYHLAGSIEAYYQEFGRSGRDGLPARCTLLYAPEDRLLQRFFARSGALDSTDLVNAHHAISQTLQDKAEDECSLKDIVQRSPLKRGKLAACLQLLASSGIVAPIGKSKWRLIDPNVERHQLERLADQSRERRAKQEVRLEQMIAYAEDRSCYWQRILDYFQDGPEAEMDLSTGCGRCDHCVATPAAA
ncbi:MAG: RecQ family ATP-dependent DNA helicase [Planctomycetaceae bacterium]